MASGVRTPNPTWATGASLLILSISSLTNCPITWWMINYQAAKTSLSKAWITILIQVFQKQLYNGIPNVTAWRVPKTKVYKLCTVQHFVFGEGGLQISSHGEGERNEKGFVNIPCNSSTNTSQITSKIMDVILIHSSKPLAVKDFSAPLIWRKSVQYAIKYFL
jgi:hypothetical protein